MHFTSAGQYISTTFRCGSAPKQLTEYQSNSDVVPLSILASMLLGLLNLPTKILYLPIFGSIEQLSQQPLASEKCTASMPTAIMSEDPNTSISPSSISCRQP